MFILILIILLLTSLLPIAIVIPILSTIVNTLVFILIGGAATMLERKFLALLQRRIGPAVVGYKGRAQFLADALKIFIKETIYIINTNHMYLVLLPTLYLFINIMAPLFFPWSNNSVYFSTEYDFMTLILLLFLSNMIIIATGFVLKNKYTQLSANRAAVMAINLDISMGFFISYFVLMFGTFNMAALLKLKSTV